MATKNLAQNEVIQIDLPADRVSSVAVTTGAAAAAGAVFVLEAQVDDASAWVTPISMVNQLVAPKVDVANLTGPAKAGCASLGGFKRCRVKRTDATGGNGEVSINAQRA
jgi:plastocyanin domain-containing protein